ncbi:MAG: glycosyltransferase [Gemmatimonadetes bacterium]|nr:glycosyltransferase [Gemmatimonadota bacterium]MCC7131718.1 glycosyltransferase [Gemmatimonadales bacterium]
MTWFAGILLGISVLVALEVLVGNRQVARLEALPPWSAGRPPRVSVVVAARDEERGIEPAVRSMLAQRYPDLELVVVDDRSTDRTGAILDRLAAEDPRLAVVQVAELPAGWLGKNHALHLGAERASGEWLLFTDADIHLAPEVVSRAVRRAEEGRFDHLAAAPTLILPGLLLKAFGVQFLFSFLSFAKPWKASDPGSRFFVGVGAFNLVRRSAYVAVGGHAPIRLRPDDDMKLGKILKRGGFRAEALDGGGMISVEWYHSLGEMVRGFEKNMFSGVEYSMAFSVAGGLAQLLVLSPLVLLPVATGLAQWLFGLQVLVALAMFAILARGMRVTPVVALLYPVVVVLFVAILWRTMFVNLRDGGIRWRGTFYSLRELKANRV